MAAQVLSSCYVCCCYCWWLGVLGDVLWLRFSGICLGNYVAFSRGQDPRGPKDWKISRFRSGIEIFKRPISDWNFQSRLKISSEPHSKAAFCGELSRSGLRFSIEIEIFNRDWKFQTWIENFKRMDWTFHAINRDWIFSIAGPFGILDTRGLGFWCSVGIVFLLIGTSYVFSLGFVRSRVSWRLCRLPDYAQRFDGFVCRIRRLDFTFGWTMFYMGASSVFSLVMFLRSLDIWDCVWFSLGPHLLAIFCGSIFCLHGSMLKRCVRFSTLVFLLGFFLFLPWGAGWGGVSFSVLVFLLLLQGSLVVDASRLWPLPNLSLLSFLPLLPAPSSRPTSPFLGFF